MYRYDERLATLWNNALVAVVACRFFYFPFPKILDMKDVEGSRSLVYRKLKVMQTYGMADGISYYKSSGSFP